MYYYDKKRKAFYKDTACQENGIDYTSFIPYTDDEFSMIKNLDDFHTCKADPNTGLPIISVIDTSIMRKKRERECFPIINRGKAWYDTLTAEQEEELKQWYQAWLNVTETKVKPVKPEWLK